MPTRTHSSDPFAPCGTLSREQLMAYAEGRLTPTEQHEVELHLEHDPLLQEALEGLQQPGASEGLIALDAMRPVPSSHSSWTRVGVWTAGIAVLLISAFLLWNKGIDDDASNIASLPGTADAVETTEVFVEPPPLENAEIVASEEQPESLYIGHRVDERHAKAMREEARVQRESGVDRLDPRTTNLGPDSTNATPLAHRKHRTSRQLLFLHDLEIVDPRELYRTVPTLSLADEHVAARFADRKSQAAVREEIKTVTYLRFMDVALGRFAANDHKGCLDDLRFVLNQYPDDVNALFYAGLCSYNLGLYKRARYFLHSAATHAVDVFDEEAQWYHALTLERLGEDLAAQEAFARIAASDGFYAERAKVKVQGTPSPTPASAGQP